MVFTKGQTATKLLVREERDEERGEVGALTGG